MVKICSTIRWYLNFCFVRFLVLGTKCDLIWREKKQLISSQNQNKNYFEENNLLFTNVMLHKSHNRASHYLAIDRSCRLSTNYKPVIFACVYHVGENWRLLLEWINMTHTSIASWHQLNRVSSPLLSESVIDLQTTKLRHQSASPFRVTSPRVR